MKKEYNELRKKYSLPSFQVINEEFLIADIDHETFILRRICSSILCTLDSAKNKLRPVLEPDTSSIVSMYENAALTEENKEFIFSVYKKLSHNERIVHVAQMGTDKDRAGAIRLILKEWKQLKLPMKKSFELLRDGWVVQQKESKKPTYLG